MSHPCEIFAAAALDRLASCAGAGAAGNDIRIVEGVHPSWDADAARVRLDWRAGDGALLQLDARVAGAPRWLTLNLDLGPGRFAPGDVIGLVAEAEAGAACVLEPFTRSTGAQGDSDTDWSGRLALGRGRDVVCALHAVVPGDAMVAATQFHMLGLRLPHRDFGLRLHNLHLFVRPQAEAAEAPPMTLAGVTL